VFQQEQEGTSLAVSTTGSTANSMNVIFRIIGRVILNDPVNLGEVEASLCDIRAEKDSCFSLAELEVGRSTLLLLLLSMNVLDWDVNVVQEVGIKLNSVAR
jgi:hypothetical protein